MPLSARIHGAVNAVAAAVSSTLELSRLLAIALDKVLEALDLEIGAILLLDEGRGVLEVVAQRGIPEELKELIMEIPLGQGVAGAVARTAQAEYIDRLARDPRATSPLVRRLKLNAVAAVPLLAQGKVLGVLEVVTSGKRRFRQAEREMLEAIGAQVGAAVSNARLYEKTRAQLEELSHRDRDLLSIHHISSRVASSLELNEVLFDAARALVELTGVDHGAVVLLEEDGERGRVAADYPPSELVSTFLSFRDYPLGRRFLSERKPIRVNDALAESGFGLARGLVEKMGVRSALYLPLLARGRLIGSIGLDVMGSPRAFSDEEVETCQAIANQVALAVDNAQLFARQKLEAEVNRALIQVAQELGRARTLGTLLPQVAEMACRLAGSRRSLVLAADKESYGLRVGASHGFRSGEAEEGTAFWKDSSGSALLQPVLQKGLQVITRQAGTESGLSQELADRFGFGCMLLVPLVAGGTPLGILCLDYPSDKRLFSPGELQIAAGLGYHAALAWENVRLTEALSASEASYRNIFDSSAEGIFLVDLDGTIRLANPAGARLLGFSRPEEVEGRKTIEFYADPAERQTVITELFQRGSIRDRRVRIRRRDGEIRHFEFSMSLIRDESGEPAGIEGMARDITDRLILQEKLAQAEKLSALGELVAGIAHELNNPLTGVLGYADLLLHQPLEEDIRRMVSSIFQQAERCRRIVHNLLGFSRKQAPSPGPVDLAAVLQQVLEVRGPALRRAGIEIRTEIPPDLPKAAGDAQQLHQVFSNLVVNAEQAMASDRGKGTLSLRARAEDGILIVDVRDDGPGISPEHLPRIFNPFFSTKEVGQGTGLGLSISYGIVKAHGGDISVESAPGQGATFSVSLPPQPVAAAEPPASAPLPDRVGARRLLIVEDEAVIRELAAKFLEREGHRVDRAASGEEAIAFLEHSSYDVIISDIRMPGLSGFELYQIVRARFPGLERRILFITGDTVSPDIQQFLRETGSRYLAKPFELKELKAEFYRIAAPPLPNGS